MQNHGQSSPLQWFDASSGKGNGIVPLDELERNYREHTALECDNRLYEVSLLCPASNFFESVDCAKVW